MANAPGPRSSAGRVVIASVAFLVLTAACSGGQSGSVDSPTPTTTGASASATDTSLPPAGKADGTCAEGQIQPTRAPDEIRAAKISDLENPASSPANLPEEGNYWRFMGRDGFGTGYEPCFVNTEDAQWSADTVVIGLEIDGDARAYATNQLIGHIVNDHVGNTPVLVTY